MKLPSAPAADRLISLQFLSADDILGNYKSNFNKYFQLNCREPFRAVENKQSEYFRWRFVSHDFNYSEISSVFVLNCFQLHFVGPLSDETSLTNTYINSKMNVFSNFEAAPHPGWLLQIIFEINLVFCSLQTYHFYFISMAHDGSHENRVS